MSEELMNGTFQAYVSGSTEHPRALIVLQEAFGVNDHIREVADNFGQAGYFVVAPHLFHRDGSPEVPYDDFAAAMSFLANLTADGITNDIIATTNFLNSMGYDSSSIGVVGYCMGGSVSFYVDTLGVVGAAVSYYGGGVENGRFGLPALLEMAPHLKAPWLGHYGDLDKGIPVDQVEALRLAAQGSEVETEIVRYADAEHGFSCDARPAVFNAAASADALTRTLAFFETHLKDKA